MAIESFRSLAKAAAGLEETRSNGNAEAIPALVSFFGSDERPQHLLDNIQLGQRPNLPAFEDPPSAPVFLQWTVMPSHER